jgi:hypothetical protein
MTGRRSCILAGGAVVLSLSVAALVFWKDLGSGVREWWRLRAYFERLADNAEGYPEHWHSKTGVLPAF